MSAPPSQSCLSGRLQTAGLFPGRPAIGAALLALALAACSGGPPPATFDLTAPSGGVRQNPGSRQLAVAEPAALQALESERIVVRGPDGSVSFLPGGQWADRLPRLLQARLIQSFENAGRAVSRAGNGVSADTGLIWDVRFFGISTEASPQAEAVFSAKLVDSSSGRIARARVFRGTEPVAGLGAKDATAALDRVSGRVFTEMVRWAAAPAIAPRPSAPEAQAGGAAATGPAPAGAGDGQAEAHQASTPSL